MTQAPKLWVPIVATVIFGGAAATTWTWVTTGDQGSTDLNNATHRKAMVAKTITPTEADLSHSQAQAGIQATSMTVDDKYVYIFAGSKLMKVDKTSLQLVNSASIITSSGTDKAAKADNKPASTSQINSASFE